MATNNMHKIGSLAMQFSSYPSKQTNSQTHKQTYSLQYFATQLGEVTKPLALLSH